MATQSRGVGDMHTLIVRGRPHKLTRERIESASEGCAETLLADGTIIRHTFIVTEVSRVEGARDDRGQPMFVCKHALTNEVEAPAALRATTPQATAPGSRPV